MSAHGKAAAPKLSKTFENPENLVHLNITAQTVALDSDRIAFFILIDTEQGSTDRIPLKLTHVQASNFNYLFSAHLDMSADMHPAIQELLVDGNKFIIYLERGSYIIPAEMRYAVGRPIQIEMKPSQTRAKRERAERKKVQGTLPVSTAKGSATVTINDLSKTGISFYCKHLLAEAGDMVSIQNKSVIIVSCTPAEDRYFYRGYFD